MSKKRKEFMLEQDKVAMGNLPRRHDICLEKTGVARPGKTAHERWKRAHRAD